MFIVLKYLRHLNDHRAKNPKTLVRMNDTEGKGSKPQVFTSTILCYITRAWIKKENETGLC